MSDDLCLIVRGSHPDRFLYSRHGGSHIDRMLLCGPRSLRRDLSGSMYRSLRQPFFERWMSGVVLVDQDAQQIWFWSSQYCAKSGLEHKLIGTLLSAVWPGWRLHWLAQPAVQLAALLPESPPDLQKLAVRARTVEAFAALQNGAWDEARAAEDLTPLIAECGEAMVRSWMEIGTHNAAACVVTDGGVHEVPLNDEWDNTALLGTGPLAVDILVARPHCPHEDNFTEAALGGAYWIDPKRKVLSLWHGVPAWSEGVGLGWDGWTVEVLAGPQEMMRRLGRDPRVLLDDGVAARLRKTAAWLLPASSPLWPLADAQIEALTGA